MDMLTGIVTAGTLYMYATCTIVTVVKQTGNVTVTPHSLLHTCGGTSFFFYSIHKIMLLFIDFYTTSDLGLWGVTLLYTCMLYKDGVYTTLPTPIKNDKLLPNMAYR